MNKESTFLGPFRQSMPQRTGDGWGGKYEAHWADGLSAYGQTIEMFRVFMSELRPRTDIIVYPGCSTDISPSQIFSGRIIYVDTYKPAVKTLKKAGLEVYHQDATQYEPDEQIDIVISRRYGVLQNHAKLLDKLRDGGYILTDGAYEQQDDILHNTQLELIGVLRKDYTSSAFVLDRESPEDYFNEVETDEEFKQVSALFDGSEQGINIKLVSFKQAAGVVYEVTGKEDNILVEFRKIVDQVKEENLPNLDISLNFDEINKTLSKPWVENEPSPTEKLLLRHNLDWVMLRLPLKKMTGERFYVLRKVLG